MRLKAGMAALALMFCGTQAADANLLTNGGFETGNLTGWTASSSYELYVCSGPFTACAGDPTNVITGAQEGDYYLADGYPGSLATITQGFADQAGLTYRVAGWVASDGGAPSALTLSVGGVVFDAEEPVSQQNWTEFTETFVGSGFDTLTIATQNGPHFNFFDNFSIDPIPEAPAWTVMLIGIGALGLVRRCIYRAAF